jgi:hypothetical protein
MIERILRLLEELEEYRDEGSIREIIEEIKKEVKKIEIERKKSFGEDEPQKYRR